MTDKIKGCGIYIEIFKDGIYEESYCGESGLCPECKNKEHPFGYTMEEVEEVNKEIEESEKS